MSHIHQIKQSEWDEAFVNFRVTQSDTKFAVVIVGIFALVALIF